MGVGLFDHAARLPSTSDVGGEAGALVKVLGLGEWISRPFPLVFVEGIMRDSRPKFAMVIFLNEEECDINVTIEGSWSPGEKEEGPSYSCGGTPAWPDTFGVESIIEDGTNREIDFDSLDESQRDAIMEKGRQEGSDRAKDDKDDRAEADFERRRDRE